MVAASTRSPAEQRIGTSAPDRRRPGRPPPACPDDGPAAPAVTSVFLRHLESRLGVRGLGYAEEPVLIPDGWETYIYRFRLASAVALPPKWARPLVLRVYACIEGLPRLRHEYVAQQCMARHGYPVARPLLLEGDAHLLGGPFMVMQAIPGRTLLDLMLWRPWRVIDGPAKMAALHARLHRLPVEDFPAPAGPFLERRLDEMRGWVTEYRLHGMAPGLDWLVHNRPPEPERPSILHLDFHPVNLMFGRWSCRAVLDWSESDVGDPHLDVATTIVLIRSAPVDAPALLQPLTAAPARTLLWRLYRNAYRRELPLDPERLRYFLAWAAFRRLCNWGRWLRVGPQVMGNKPSSIRYLSANRVNLLRHYIRKWAGVEVSVQAIG
jgi:aminoglycoside phosphotransferase (APT) family kinase protein